MYRKMRAAKKGDPVGEEELAQAAKNKFADEEIRGEFPHDLGLKSKNEENLEKKSTERAQRDQVQYC